MPTIIAFIVVFGLIVFFHELGHFLVAKLAKVVVYEFALGFGPAIFQRKFGETSYSIRLLPLGGFVKLAGMDEAENSLDTIEEDDPGSFNNKSLFVRLSTIAAGPLMNFVLAAVILTLFSMLIFVPPTIVSILQDSPADNAGLLPGDEIVTIQGEQAQSLDQIISLINSTGGQELELSINRSGEKFDIIVVPQVEDEQGMIGVSLNAKPRFGFMDSIVNGLSQTWLFIRETIMAIGGMFSGRVEPEVAGPIGIYQMVGTFAAEGIGSLMLLAALLNVNLGLLNLLPVPVLDGGWITIMVIEAVRGKPIKEEHKGMAQLIGLALLLMLMVFATYSDIVKLFS